MIKKYLLIIMIMAVAISSIIYFGFKWKQISVSVQRNIDIQSTAYKLEIENEKQKFLLITLPRENRIQTLSLSKKLLHELHRLILDSQDAVLMKHLKKIESELLKKELYKNDITSDLEKITKHIDAVLTNLHQEAFGIVRVILASMAFLVFFGLVVYIREIRGALKSARLQNELQGFVGALNESAIVSKTDLDGNITYANKKFCEISGYTQEELIGKNHNIVRHRDTPSSLFKELWETIESKKIFKTTIKNIDKNGKPYHVDSAIIPMLGTNDEIVEYLALRYDVSELVNARDDAIMAEKAKDEFLSNMSHELRTPLNAINGFSTILKREITDEKHSMYIQNILDSSDNLVVLIGDILDLSKLQSGKFTLDYHDFNMYEKMERFLVRFDAQLELSNLKMKIELDESIDARFHGDWLRISQIVTNLISNALKFTPSGGKISIGCKYEDANVKILVADTGIGMSQEVQAKVFEPFEQADTSTTRRYGGTGLGLSIVLNLVEQMDGSLELNSQEGVGSEFIIALPLAKVLDANNDELQEKDIADKKILNGHILIAEDNKTNQLLIGILVEEFGLSYKMVNDGVEAVGMFGREKFDLVLMDENMPNMNGTQAVKEIHTLYGNDVPIVALTANVMSGDKERFLEAGMDGYVAKPIDEEELYRVVKYFLDKKHKFTEVIYEK